MARHLKMDGCYIRGKDLYDMTCEHLGRDMDPLDIVYLNYHNESFVCNDLYHITKEFLEYCGKTKVVFINSSSHGPTTSDTVKKLFGTHDNFYLAFRTDWLSEQQTI